MHMGKRPVRPSFVVTKNLSRSAGWQKEEVERALQKLAREGMIVPHGRSWAVS